jgi:hypothetical protein
MTVPASFAVLDMLTLPASAIFYGDCPGAVFGGDVVSINFLRRGFRRSRIGGRNLRLTHCDAGHNAGYLFLDEGGGSR